MRAVGVLACLLVGCGSGASPDLLGLSDQVAVVGQEFVLELEGVDPDGDNLTYGVKADIPLEGVATISRTPSGNGVFRWTPLASDAGQRAFDFSVSDGDNTTTVSIVIDVRATGAGIPVFRQPLGSGRVLNLASDPCATVDILIEDEDTAQVTIAEEAPLIAGAMFSQSDGQHATWRWCPTQAQIAESNRYTLTLSADDGDNAKTLKEYVLVLGSMGSTLIINEIDYDNIGTDSSEYIEILNTSSQTVQLAGLGVALVNGATGATYQTIDLASATSLDAGQYLVITRDAVFVPSTAKKIDPVWISDQIQNGAPDGVAIFDSVTLTVLDALSYEGSVTAAQLPGFAQTVNLVEGTELPPATVYDVNDDIRTICRDPNGQDTNNAANDFKVCTNRSVGKANLP